MKDEQLLRYSRNILLPQVDVSGQERLLKSKVLIVGLGGLGSPVAFYLAAAGVGHMVLADDDSVELSNLQRQILHDESTIGWRKTESAKHRLEKLNATIRVDCVHGRFDPSFPKSALDGIDIVLDCTDSLGSRQSINRICYQQKLMLVSAAAIRFQGQGFVCDFREGAGPCYECLWKSLRVPDLSCAESGVFPPLLGMMGAWQASECLKAILGLRVCAPGELVLVDALNDQRQVVRFGAWRACSVCGDSAEC